MRTSLLWKTVAVLFAVLLVPSFTMAAIPQSEHDALMSIYNSTGGPSWTDNTNWGGALGTESTWKGVQLNAGGSSVYGLWLGSNNLSGTLPAAIGNLPNLQYIEITGNSVTGSLPPELGNLTNLVGMWFGVNQFSGSLPPELGNLSALERMSLSYNQLTGSIPPELGNLSSLLEIELNSNLLTGSIPPEFGNLTNLQRMSLYSNQLSGGIPSGLGALSNLLSLDLYGNQLTGNIPASLGNLSNLESLSLATNQLTGNIPPELGNLSALVTLQLKGNLLTGSIPPELGNLSNLNFLDLSENQLSGPIPPQLGELTKLQYLIFQYNQLSGGIPSQIGSLSGLAHLSLRSNQLTGSLPTEIGNLTNLISLDLFGNSLSGNLPATLGNLTNLWGFNLASNNFSGSIPPQLGNLVSLSFLYLNWNHLSGGIPPEMGNLTTLEILGLQGNILIGDIPLSLTNMTGLLNGNGLDISYNGLYSTDGTLTSFLDAKSSGWDATQTIAPADVAAAALSPTSANVSWTPILYTQNTGGYRIYFSETSGGPYTLFGTTANKSAGSMTVNGLAPGTDYCFVVNSVTNPHPSNPNMIISEFSSESCAATEPCPAITVSAPATTTAIVGTFFSQEFTASGGTAPYTFTTASDLPAGMTLAGSGTLSGIPAEAGTFPMTVTATDNYGCTGNTLYTLTIYALPSPPVITEITDNDPCAQTGITISFTPGTPATRHDLRVDSALAVSGVSSPVSYNPGDTISHSYVLRAVNTDEACFTDSAPVNSTDVTGTPSQPVITGIADNDYFTFGLKISYTPGAPAVRHDLYKDGVLAVTGFPSGGTYTGRDTLSHSYAVLAVNGLCTALSNPVIAADMGTRFRPRADLPPLYPPLFPSD